MSWREPYVAVDWGTTNRRAYAIDAAGRLEDIYEDALGVTAVPAGGFGEAVASIKRRFGDRPMLMAGMVGSNRGWVETPYVRCPAGAADLAAAIIWVEPGRIGIVPGVSQVGAPGADVMRGEEVQAIGAVAAGLAGANALICHPGTHAKWIMLSGGKIAAFKTMMTGEMFSLLRKHSILASEFDQPAAIDGSFRNGAANGLGGDNLLAALFGIRARRLVADGIENPSSYASGLLIGSDVGAGLALWPDLPIVLVGRPDLCALYAEVLGAAGKKVGQVDGQTAFLAGIHLLTEML